MLSRSALWQRLSGAPLWPLAWALAAACTLPWLLPERWDGRVAFPWLILGWIGLALCLLRVRSRRWAVVPLAAILMAITFLGLQRQARWETALPTGFQAVEGRIDAPWTLQGERLGTRLAVASPASLRGLALPLTVPADGEQAPPAPGTPVRLRAELRSVAPAPVFLAERPLWRARSDEAPRRIHLASAQLLEPLGPPAPSPLLRLQVFVRRRFEALPLDPTAKDLWGALALGIPPADESHFSVFAESGTIHILVVSGLQVTLVMVAVEALLRRLRLRGASAGSIAAGLLYCGLVGFSAPVWRGLFMGVAWALGRTSGWKLPPVAGLHLALLLWLLGHPAAGVEPGFLLAWWALLGLLWGAEPLAGLVAPLLGRLALPFARLAAPWLSTLPLLALLHGGAPRWGILANLLVLPLVAFLTPVCLLLILVPLPGLTPAAAAVLTWMGDRLVPALTGIAPLATGILWPWLALALGWLLLAHRQALHRRSRALTVALVAGSLVLLGTRGTGQAPTTLSLEAVDVGQGDGLLLRVPGGDATVVDTGPLPWSGRRLVRVLSRRGVREPIHLVITHAHGDHAGGWSTLARLWPLASTGVPATADEDDPWAPYAPARYEAQGLLRGDAWTRGPAAFSVRWPPRPFALPDPNMVSLVLRVRWQDRELWLMGDALAPQERDLMDLGDPGLAPHRLLKVGHHGSRNASDPAWIAALDPELAIIPAGLRNRFEHPHRETLAGLAAHGLQPWVTGLCGGVRVEAVAGGWALTTGDGRRAFTAVRGIPSP
ncbi:DNA internalization-related competence protein ComEC/Rec2 [Geothrix rubra]|uniref:DNA internalization-related competence protein ComEC/Rec2 n=1 Tax=Geothrix rubra TaxID=2927977 RepID=A0ABQ5Q9H5_9BACT|nr:ComEC/Rec2 family competence protein [Geothrix rubra]GLH71484.1 DNA internalization-related competence protein ComEC/Rec2 [Geothrix rubra]